MADGDKKTRRARGTGTIFHDERRGVWVGRVPVGRTATGTTRYVTRSAATQKALVELLKTAGPPGPGTTVSQWCDRWLATLAVRPGSEDRYRQHVERRIRPSFGAIRVRDLMPHHIEAAVRKWPVKASTARNCLAVFNVCLGEAGKVGLCLRNPLDHTRMPKVAKTKIDPFSVAELGRIVAGATDPGTRIFAVLAATGCRGGEAMGLDVGDWDAAARTVAITKTQRRKARGTGPPKSANSTRTIEVPGAAVPAIVAAVGGRRAGPLFVTGAGKRLTYATLFQTWGRVAAATGLPRRNMHQLRHSVATAMISAGTPIGDVAKYLGDTPETIVKTYLHASGANPAATMNTLFAAARTPPNDGKVEVR